RWTGRFPPGACARRCHRGGSLGCELRNEFMSSKKVPAGSGEPLSLIEISGVLAPFTGEIELSSQQLEQIQSYVELLIAWNRSVSLTAIEDRAEIVSRHFGESIFAASVIPIRNGRLADVGTGAGFPGVPLKIAHEELMVSLFEPNQKKCAFLT